MACHRLAWVALALSLVALPPATAAAQDTFEQARQLAFAGDRQAARAILLALVDDQPEHWDARVLLGRLQAWDREYEAAREELQRVVRARPDYADARNALVDVELWSDRPDRAVDLLQQGLSSDPTRQEFLYRLAQAQRATGDLDAAVVTLDRLLTINPAHDEGRQMFGRLRIDRLRHKVGFSYGYTGINDLPRPWHEASVRLTRRTTVGTVIGRVNYANRFDQSTAQYEVEAYPRLRPGVYLYANYGFSPNRIYPHHSYAGELYGSLGHGVELSGGFRRLQFESSAATIFTGSVSKYHQDWLFSFRPSVTPRRSRTSRSYQGTVRRYLGNPDTFVDLVVGSGASPGELLDRVDLTAVDSRRIRVRGEAAIGPLFILTFQAGYTRYSASYSQEELFFDRRRKQFSAGLGIERRF